MIKVAFIFFLGTLVFFSEIVSAEENNFSGNTEFEIYRNSMNVSENIISKIITSDAIPYYRIQGMLLGCDELNLVDQVMEKGPKPIDLVDKYLLEATKMLIQTNEKNKDAKINKYIVYSHVQSWVDGFIWGSYDETIRATNLQDDYCKKMSASSFTSIMKK